jgi:phage/plasmid primase-like uncharacterized protein
MSQNHTEDFRAAMRASGIDYLGPILQDGILHRVKCEGDSEANSWYKLYPADPIAAGAFGCWKRQVSDKWRQNGNSNCTPQELAKLRQKCAEDQKSQDKAQEERWQRFALEAQKELTTFKRGAYTHDYLRTKAVTAYGNLLENDAGDLVLPLQDAAGKVWSYQTIDFLGDKLFRPGGKVSGCFYSVCDRKDGPLVICEGYATGATVHQATGWAVACAMNCGNLESVSTALREANPGRPMIIAADNDRFTKKPGGEPWNPGISKARVAAKETKCKLVFPEFPEDSTKGTDFNDLAEVSGVEAVLSIFNRAMPSPLSILSFDEISVIPTSPHDKLLGDRLLNRGGNMTIVGAGGTGKTRLVYQFLGSCYAGHEKFLTLDIHPGARNFRWLILQAENSIQRLQDTRSALLKWMPKLAWLKMNELVRVLCPIDEKDTFLNLDNPEVIARIQQSLDLFVPDGIIYDSLYDFGVGDLNKDADMRKTVTSIGRLSRHRNPKRPMIVLHHSLTGQTAGSNAIGANRASFGRNSKVLYNWSRAQINIAPMSEENNDHLAISCGKCSDGREFHSFAVKLNEETMFYDVDSETDVSEWAREKRTGSVAPAISSLEVANLCGAGSRKNELAKKISEAIGCSKQNAYRHIRKAAESGKIRESGELIFRG